MEQITSEDGNHSNTKDSTSNEKLDANHQDSSDLPPNPPPQTSPIQVSNQRALGSPARQQEAAGKGSKSKSRSKSKSKSRSKSKSKSRSRSPSSSPSRSSHSRSKSSTGSGSRSKSSHSEETRKRKKHSDKKHHKKLKHRPDAGYISKNFFPDAPFMVDTRFLFPPKTSPEALEELDKSAGRVTETAPQ
jgi:hypothetical protein